MSKPMSPDYLAEIAARAEAVTDGPWGPHLGVTTNVFIAHARADVPALLAEVERLRAELAARPTRAEVLRETAPEMDAIAHEYGVFGVGGRLRQLADAAEAGESK